MKYKLIEKYPGCSHEEGAIVDNPFEASKYPKFWEPQEVEIDGKKIAVGDKWDGLTIIGVDTILDIVYWNNGKFTYAREIGVKYAVENFKVVKRIFLTTQTPKETLYDTEQEARDWAIENYPCLSVSDVFVMGDKCREFAEIRQSAHERSA